MDNDKNNNGSFNPVQVQKHLSGVDYPASKQDLIDAADRNGADEMLKDTLDRLPEKEYQKPNDVTEELGKLM
jgi:hypothetical protein